MSKRKPIKTAAHGSSGEQAQPTGRGTFPVVGIGASAGGLEASQLLLNALPADLGLAYILLPHLDPTHDSAFAEIMGRATRMPVSDAKDGESVQPNHVYVIPRNCEMTISHGILCLRDRELWRSTPMTIDVFLRSLAFDLGNNAIGVILSGTASDGTSGLAAIRDKGGITFAQDESARYDGMPSSAIAADCVDFVLPPEGIARELARIARHPYVVNGHTALEEVANTKEGQMLQLFAIVRRATRVDFSEYKAPTIARRVGRRMALHKIEKLDEYIPLLQRDRAEVLALYQDLLINVTTFFRDPEAFEALKKVVYAPLLSQRENNGNLPIRIWVPGCSTGEETYSHAMALLEYFGEQRVAVSIQVFGTDLSENAIQRARSGIYPESIEADVSGARLRRFFHRVDNGYQISRTIRDLCIFSMQNVFSDPPFSRIDLVSCRNVMIYLSQTLQKRVLPIFHYALNPNGALMLGSTEGLLGSGAELFELADKKQKIYRKKAMATPMNFGFAVQSSEKSSAAPPAAIAAKAPEAPRVAADLQREADRLLLARYAPPSAVVNENLEIVQTRGHTGPYLELPPGRASLNLLNMARPGLVSELQSAIEEARKSGVEAVRGKVQVENDGGAPSTFIRVTPFRTPVQDKASFLVAFEPPQGETASSSDEVIVSPLREDERTRNNKQIAQLKQELAATKDYLQSIIDTLEATNEELQSASQEIQSGNEELQSTNEELQTSKEELESANEELHTVNEEMQQRNELLSLLNNDLNNLLNSVSLPVVMVGPDLSVRRFTPPASKALGLTGTDIGRPITRLRLNLESANVEQMMLDVMSEMRPMQQRVRDREGRWCDLRLTPYRTADNRIDGVVLTVLSFDPEVLPGARAGRRQKKASPAGAKKKVRKKGSKKGDD